GRPPRASRPPGRRPRPAARGLSRGHHPAPPGGPDLRAGGRAHGPVGGQRGQTVGAGPGPVAACPARGLMKQAESQSPPSAAPPADERVIRAMHEYLAALEAGARPDRAEFLAAHPDIAEELADCLEGLEFVHAVGPRLSHPRGFAPADAPPSSGELPAEG